MESFWVQSHFSTALALARSGAVSVLNFEGHWGEWELSKESMFGLQLRDVTKIIIHKGYKPIIAVMISTLKRL